MSARAVNDVVWIIHLFGYFNVATVTILVYDYCLTFAQEVSFVWNSPWSVIYILYLLSRYMPFVDTGFVLRHQFTHGLGSKETCILAYRMNASLFVIGVGISEIILMVRIWVIWNKDRRLAIGLPIFFSMIWIGIFVSMWYFLRSLRFSSAPIPGFSGCYSTKNTMVLVEWALFMAFEIVMLGLLLIKGIRAYNLSRSVPLFRVVYRDGVLFYIFIVGISASNVILIISSPHVALLLTPFGRVMHSILTARFVLKLRQKLNNKPDIQGEHILSTELVSTEIGFASTENSDLDNMEGRV